MVVDQVQPTLTHFLVFGALQIEVHVLQFDDY